MDIQEINRTLAEQMGWQDASAEGWANPLSNNMFPAHRLMANGQTEANFGRGAGWELWNPTSDLNQAKLIVDKIVESGREVSIRGNTMGYNVSFYEYSAGGKRNYLGKSGEPTLPLAICLAAIQLVEDKK